MKHILESEESFMAYATIDECYFLLKNQQKEFFKPRDGLTQMIDKATGHDAQREKESREYCIELMEEMIKHKKIIEADISHDLEFLKQLKNGNSNSV